MLKRAGIRSTGGYGYLGNDRYLGCLLVLKLLLWFSAMANVSMAVEINGLYNAEALVIDKTQRVRSAAAQDALAEVLIRVSGSPQILLDQHVRRELLKPDVYLLQYSYESSSQVINDESGKQIPAKRLLLSFDPALVLQALKDAELPIWSSNRPNVLVWWGMEEQGSRQLLSADASSQSGVEPTNGGNRIAASLLEQSKRRGLPLTLPLMDLQDSGAVKASDVWGFFTENIEVASRRYGPEAILVGRALPSLTGEWLGSWMLLVDGQSYWYEGKGDSIELILAEAVDSVADRLAEKYAVIVREDPSLGLTLKLFDIGELKDYAAASSYLDGLVPVRKARLQQVDGSTLTFNILLDGDVDQLKQAIELDNKLLPVIGVPFIASRPSNTYGKIVPDGYVDSKFEGNRISHATVSLPENSNADYNSVHSTTKVAGASGGSGKAMPLVVGPYLEYRWVGE